LLAGSFEEIKQALTRTQAALEKSETERSAEAAYFRQIADTISEALWLAALGQEHAFYVNPAYEKLWGRSAASLYADPKSFVDSIHPEDRDRILAGLPRQTRGDYDVEYRILRPDGATRWVRDRVFPVQNERGEIYRIAGISEDITEHKQLERQQLDLAVEREKVKLLRDFIHDVSHDIKTPLTAVNLKIHQLTRAEEPAKRRALLDELRQLSNRMGQMIEDLLTLTRLDSLSEMRLTTLNLNQMLSNLSKTVRILAEAKDVRLNLDLDPAHPLLHADEDDLLRAMTNLLENAVRYTPEGGEVTVQTRLSERTIFIRVSDTGIGIAPDDQPRIFERFYRAYNARAVDSGGTGLGLSIVKKVVERHRGQIEFTSAVGMGTTFTVSLPGLN